MFFGMLLLFSPLISLLKWIPLVGYLLAHVASFIASLFSFVFAVTFSSLTIGLAWLYYRPKYGIPLLLLVVIGICVMFVAFPNDSQQATQNLL
jgi:hypothetical protein